MKPEYPTLPVSLGHDSAQVALAMALFWTFRSNSEIQNLLRQLGLKRNDGRAFVLDDVKTAVREMRRLGVLVAETGREGYNRLRDDMRAPLYRYLLEAYPAETLRNALFEQENFRPDRAKFYWPINSFPASVAVLRVMLFTGMAEAEFVAVLERAGLAFDATRILREAFMEGFDPVAFARVTPALRDNFLYQATYLLDEYWSPALLPVADFLIARLDADPAGLVDYLRLTLADHLLQRGDFDRCERALAGLDSGAADAMRAARLVLEGDYAQARPLLEAAIKRRQGEVGARKHVFPESLAWYYPLTLIAEPTPANLEKARKFCIGESGKKTPSEYEPWGLWVHAVSTRLGLIGLHRTPFVVSGQRPQGKYYFSDLWRLLLAAWTGGEALGLGEKELTDMALGVAGLRQRLLACNLHALVRLLDAAWAVLRGEEPPKGFIVSAQAERWREVLDALSDLAGGEAGAAKVDSRLVWAITLTREGRLADIAAMEQKRGTRGWNKPRETTLGKVAGAKQLPPWDAKVARCLHPDRFYPRRFGIDMADAVMALVGHPCVVLAEAPEQFVELAEGMPELDVVRDGEGFRLRISPEPHPEIPGDYYFTEEGRRAAEALRLVTLVRETPQRLKVIRLNETHKRAAQLLGKRFEVPAAAQQELQQTLHGLARHFQVHSDSTEAAREVAAESRLRAEIAPDGQALTLRLVVAPLGPDGPRLEPASGRVRIMAAIGAETVGARRDLTAERGHLDAVLDALPFLEAPEIQGGCDWRLDDPEQALAMVEAMPGLAGVAAVDWPKGKSVRVVNVDPAKLGLKVTSERDWFRLGGQARLDDGLVVAFETLLEAARGKSRFIPIGDGTYAALTRSLKERLNDLAAVAEPAKGGARVPRLAAAWLDDALEDVEAEFDVDFTAAVQRLRAAQDTQPVLPKALQAELRPYQEDGYQWAMRLAGAGFGACLADDMGLGKTLQALAVLLARGGDGPALVIAPTSVCGNWLAEARRFAPSLNARIYGEDGRDDLIAGAGPMDLVIVSYTLVQQAGDSFAGRTWHTLIADEAQAIKNAAAKRSQAVFELDAAFRLALSGTPVENRLAELWSIMRFANPGLLGTLARFNERFANPIERGRDRDAQRLLRRLIGPFVLRRTKGQVLQDLPERTELVLDIAPEAAEAAHYEAIRRQAVAEIEASLESATPAVAKFNILAQLTKLRRAACDPRLVTAEPALVGAKVQAFAELAAELVANGHKALVFSQFVDFLQLLRAPLDQAGIAYQYLDGATPAAERTRRVAAFQAGEGDLFLISLKAGGFGLNLTAADYVVIADPWWNPAAEDQAMGRAHRMGQLRPVTVYRLVLKGTIEERILELHSDKRALAEGVLSGEEGAVLPTTEDLIALMRGD